MSGFEFEIQDLKKNYYGRPAIRDLNLTIEKGSFNFLLGSNGSGKSTLLKCLAGHQLWDSGEIFRFGKNRKLDSANFNQGLHLISEDIFPPLASLDALKHLYANIFGRWNEPLFKRLLSYGQLDESKTLQGCSRGQKIQAILALTYACTPETILIDEATAVLDPFIRSRFIYELAELVKQHGTTVVVATNIATELAGYDGRLLIMSEGSLALDIPSQLISNEFAKIRASEENFEVLKKSEFSFIDKNSDGGVSFVGRRTSLTRLQIAYEEDRRALTIAEVFIHFSDRKRS